MLTLTEKNSMLSWITTAVMRWKMENGKLENNHALCFAKFPKYTQQKKRRADWKKEAR